MESTGSQVFIKEEMGEETKESLGDFLTPEPFKEEDPLERWLAFIGLLSPSCYLLSRNFVLKVKSSKLLTLFYTLHG